MTSAAAKIRFHDRHAPELLSGDFEITVEQVVKAVKANDVDVSPTGFPPVNRRFRVAGPRFHLDPQDVGAIFPPEASIGDHSTALPHVVLTRSTLPWERRASTAGDHDPWLVLLLVSEGDAGVAFAPKLRTVGTGADQASVITLPLSYLRDVMPKRADLRFLCHVRETERPVVPPPSNPAAPTMQLDSEVAVVMGSRLPASGKQHAAFLVSVAGDYSASAYAPATVNAQGNVDLVVLKQWRFSCSSPQHTFVERVRSLNADPLVLQSPVMAAQRTDGATLCPYRLRGGGRAASFYRGPLTPGPVSPPAGLPKIDTLRTSDALMLYHEGTGFFDASYAAAWELGRLTGLTSAAYWSALLKWRGAARQHRIATEQAAAVPYLSGSPIRDPHDGLSSEITLFLDKLASLELVPPNYLLPDDDVLPVDSIRFFRVDAFWRACLIEGAVSLGRLHVDDHTEEGALRDYVSHLGAGPKSGFVLRSDIVNDWPDILMDGFDAAGIALSPSHVRHLSDTYLLALFDAELAALELHLKPEALHMGFHMEAQEAYKWLKLANGSLPDAGNALPSQRKDMAVKVAFNGGGFGVVNVSQLATDMETRIKASPGIFGAAGFGGNGPAFFALQMIESIERPRFVIR